MLASEGLSLGLVSRCVYLLILGTTAVTSGADSLCAAIGAPALYLGGVSATAQKNTSKKVMCRLAIADDLPTQNHVVVCGYGQIGRNIVRLLQDRELSSRGG